MAYRVIDKETYYRKDVFRRFSEDCKCSLSMTARIDVTDLLVQKDRDKVLSQLFVPAVPGHERPGGLPHGLFL